MVGVAGEFLDLVDHPGEHVCVVVAGLALKHHAEPLEAHSGVYVLGRQRLQRAVRVAVVLHEDKVPDLDDLVVVGVDKVFARDFGDLLVRAQVDVDLAARAARARVAHLPEVVVLVAEDDVVLRHQLHPGLSGLLVESRPVFGRTLEHGGVELRLVDLVDFRQEFPGPGDGLGLEIVAEAPVAEHLEHRVVPSIVAHGFEVVVLSADPEALLRIRRPFHLRHGVAQKYVLELVHSGVGEHQRRVVLDHHRC